MSACSKLERLLNLTALLLDARRPLTAERDPARSSSYPEDAGGFRRAFERDKDELRDDGHPARASSRSRAHSPEVDGYRIPREEYALRDPGLTPTSWPRSHLAASAVQLEGLPATEGLLKLGGLVTDGGRDLGVHVAPLPADPNLARLFGAVASRRPVAAPYRDEDRTVDPYRLEFQRGRWYLTGYDHLRDEERNFRLDRIEGDGRAHRRPRLRAARPPRSRAQARGRGSSAPRSRSAARGARRRPPGQLGRAARRPRPRRRARTPTARWSSSCRSRTGPRSARSCSASSTTPRCSSRPSCATTSSTGSASS